MSKYSFDLVDKKKPDLVLKSTLEEISKDTRGYVKGCVAAYSGYITSYVKKTGYVFSLQNMMGSEEKVDIQDDLGEQNNDTYKYEAFLTVKGISEYKYRLLFMKYGTISYPVTIVMNEDLAAQCFEEQKPTVMLVDTMSELEQLVKQVISSEYFENIVQKLIFEALRQEDAEKEKTTPPRQIGKVSQ